MSEMTIVAGSAVNDGPLYLPFGHSIFPFYYQLPNSVPSSFEGKKC